jgi:hypothetical protein
MRSGALPRNWISWRTACGYEGPEFMWTWHHYSSCGALVQDQQSLALRVVDARMRHTMV